MCIVHLVHFMLSLSAHIQSTSDRPLSLSTPFRFNTSCIKHGGNVQCIAEQFRTCIDRITEPTIGFAELSSLETIYGCIGKIHAISLYTHNKCIRFAHCHCHCHLPLLIVCYSHSARQIDTDRQTYKQTHTHGHAHQIPGPKICTGIYL